MARAYRQISADSHIDLSPEVWTHRVPSKWRDEAPRVVKLENGAEAVQMGNGPPRRISYLAHAGLAKDEIHRQVPTFATAAGAGSPEQRLREQDEDGIDAEILFSAVGNVSVLRQLGDDEGYLALLRAYNEYLAEEYCEPARDRLVVLGVIPSSGVADAIRELN